MSQKTRITIDEAKAGMATATGELWAAYNTIVSLTAAVAALQEAYDEQEKLLEYNREALR